MNLRYFRCPPVEFLTSLAFVVVCKHNKTSAVELYGFLNFRLSAVGKLFWSILASSWTDNVVNLLQIVVTTARRSLDEYHYS